MYGKTETLNKSQLPHVRHIYEGDFVKILKPSNQFIVSSLLKTRNYSLSILNKYNFSYNILLNKSNSIMKVFCIVKQKSQII